MAGSEIIKFCICVSEIVHFAVFIVQVKLYTLQFYSVSEIVHFAVFSVS